MTLRDEYLAYDQQLDAAPGTVEGPEIDAEELEEEEYEEEAENDDEPESDEDEDESEEEEESDVEVDDEDMGDVDPAFRKRVEEALRAAGMDPEGDGHEGADGEEDEAESSDEEVWDDEQMMKVDEHLAKVFRDRKEGNPKQKAKRTSFLSTPGQALIDRNGHGQCPLQNPHTRPVRHLHPETVLQSPRSRYRHAPLASRPSIRRRSCPLDENSRHHSQPLRQAQRSAHCRRCARFGYSERCAQLCSPCKLQRTRLGGPIMLALCRAKYRSKRPRVDSRCCDLRCYGQ